MDGLAASATLGIARQLMASDSDAAALLAVSRLRELDAKHLGAVLMVLARAQAPTSASHVHSARLEAPRSRTGRQSVAPSGKALLQMPGEGTVAEWMGLQGERGVMNWAIPNFSAAQGALVSPSSLPAAAAGSLSCCLMARI